MSHRLRKPTRWFRATVDQQLRLVVTPEEDAVGNPHSVRRITVVCPESQRLYVALDPADADLGTSRASYLACEAPPGFPTRFLVKPEQRLALAADIAKVEASIIIEYLETE